MFKAQLDIRPGDDCCDAKHLRDSTKTFHSLFNGWQRHFTFLTTSWHLNSIKCNVWQDIWGEIKHCGLNDTKYKGITNEMHGIKQKTNWGHYDPTSYIEVSVWINNRHRLYTGDQRLYKGKQHKHGDQTGVNSRVKKPFQRKLPPCCRVGFESDLRRFTAHWRLTDVRLSVWHRSPSPQGEKTQ